jgi:hypothetical protein
MARSMIGLYYEIWIHNTDFHRLFIKFYHRMFLHISFHDRVCYVVFRTAGYFVTGLMIFTGAPVGTSLPASGAMMEQELAIVSK